MDVFVKDEVFKISLFGWAQMPIKRIEKEKNLYILIAFFSRIVYN